MDIIQADKAYREAMSKALSEERASDPKFLHGHKWAKVWSVLWVASSIASTVLLWIINEEASSVRRVSFSDASHMDIFLIAILTFFALFWLVLLLLTPMFVYAGNTREASFAMLLFTGLFLLTLLLFLLLGDIRLFIVAALVALMMVLTALMFFQPSIRYQSARFNKIQKQYSPPLKKGRNRLWP